MKYVFGMFSVILFLCVRFYPNDNTVINFIGIALSLGMIGCTVVLDKQDEILDVLRGKRK